MYNKYIGINIKTEKHFIHIHAMMISYSSKKKKPRKKITEYCALDLLQ